MRISDWSSDVCSSDLAAADRAALVPDDRIVDAGAVDIAPLHRIAGVVLGDQVDAVILEPCGRAAAHRLIEPPERIIGQRRAAREIGRAACRERVCEYV